MFVFECKLCGRCCKPGFLTDPRKTSTTYVRLTDDDICRIASFLSLSIEDLCDLYRIKGNSINCSKSQCTFLGDNNQCSIHQVKPHCCKKWPYINRHNKRVNILESMQYCPGISLKESS